MPYRGIGYGKRNIHTLLNRGQDKLKEERKKKRNTKEEKKGKERKGKERKYTEYEATHGSARKRGRYSANTALTINIRAVSCTSNT